MPGIDETSAKESPAAPQLAIAVLGGALLGAASRDRRPSSLARLAGLALVGVAARPLLESLVLRAGRNRRRIEIQSSLEVARAVRDVFAFFKDFENYPRIFGGVRSIVDDQNGTSHWQAYSPSGHLLEWDAVVTKFVPNSVIAFESVPGSAIQARTILRFTPITVNRTRVDFEAVSSPAKTTLKEAIGALMSPPPVERVRAAMENARFYLEAFESPAPAADRPTPPEESQTSAPPPTDAKDRDVT
ncbi:MAG TPA: SRPBCC family protein [Gemmatimonadaceae bacterium]